MELCRLHKRKGILRYVSIPFLRDIGMETWENGTLILDEYILIIWEVIRVQFKRKYNRDGSRFFSRAREAKCGENLNRKRKELQICQ